MMTEGSKHALYRAREKGLHVHALDDEVLVYDLDRHKAHCMSRPAALVWQHCDGRTDVSKMAQLLARELNTPFNEEMVWLALKQLDKARLLESRLARPAPQLNVSRREVLKKVGLAAAISIPVISSIMSPTPAQAATCLRKGTTCTSSLACCSHVCNTSVTPHVCL
ncbi:MAG TPA: PqqD family protein [Blastocatellia bacterium]|nr:PqqD family protein [Blastocatellia bacterium]